MSVRIIVAINPRRRSATSRSVQRKARGPPDGSKEVIMEDTKAAAFELHTMRRAFRNLANRWGLSSRELAELLPAGGREDIDPPLDTETRMRILIEVNYRIGMADEGLEEWLRTSSRTLRGLSPLDAMSGSLGDLRGIRAIVDRGFAS